MFARIVECTLKPEKIDEFTRAIHNDVRPFLQKQRGFVDEITLISDVNSGQAIVLTFWKSKQDAEEYERKHYANIVKNLQALLSGTPRVNKASVASSSLSKIAPKKKAVA